MTNKQEIQRIYDETILKLKKLQKERDDIISSYIKKLEEKKIKVIKDSLDLQSD